MKKSSSSVLSRTATVFLVSFGICVCLGVILSYAAPASASATLPVHGAGELAVTQPITGTNAAGPQQCVKCHADIVNEWSGTRHAAAFSSPIFQQAWTKDPNKNACLQCHTTGYQAADGTYTDEGVTCASCHGPYQEDHPKTKMPITPDATLCANCHKSTTNEWRASKHSEAGIQCQACHDPHAQKQKAEDVNALCTNCHKDPGQTFTHGTHSNAGLQCSNCHMYTNVENNSPVGGLLATGHTFAVGSETCIGCHRDTVHTRDKILALTGEVTKMTDLDKEQLLQKAQSQEQEITSLKADGETRLYVGLAQGAIVGLAVGAVAAWIVSRRLKIVDEIVIDESEGKKAR
ncbi:MAG: cytochrome c3 family protein [Anaerolineae bacterium]